MKKPTDSKNTMLAHSEAKVNFFKTYLERYLRILYLSPYIEEINIFDVFCGTGIYDNGKKGSPIVAFDAIKKLREEFGYNKRINLIVNDGKAEKLSNVQKYIDDNNNNDCIVEYFNESAELMFNKILASIKTQNKNVRNLIFIDPYGYKEIKKTILEELLENKRTEIILFLPISQMQRFTAKAVESDLEPYKPLRIFVDSFFEENHPIRKQTVKSIEYIDFVKQALRFDKYYSTSYFIERDEANYYALFFISSHVYGFEHILKVKWDLDEEDGQGFRQQETQPFFSLFEQQGKELAKNDNYERLEKILKDSLTTPKNNQEIYEIILENEFLPKHATEIFRNWQRDLKNFEVIEIETNKPAKKGYFYINWDWYNPRKNSKPKVRFSI